MLTNLAAECDDVTVPTRNRMWADCPAPKVTLHCLSNCFDESVLINIGCGTPRCLSKVADVHTTHRLQWCKFRHHSVTGIELITASTEGYAYGKNIQYEYYMLSVVTHDKSKDGMTWSLKSTGHDWWIEDVNQHQVRNNVVITQSSRAQ